MSGANESHRHLDQYPPERPREVSSDVSLVRLRDRETPLHFMFEASRGNVSCVVAVDRRMARESDDAAWWARHGNSAMAARETLRWAENRALSIALRTLCADVVHAVPTPHAPDDR